MIDAAPVASAATVASPGADAVTAPGPAGGVAGNEQSQLPIIGVALALGLMLGGLLVGLLWLALERRRRRMTPGT